MEGGEAALGEQGESVVDIDGNSHPGTEFGGRAGVETGGGVMRSRRRHWRKQAEVTHE